MRCFHLEYSKLTTFNKFQNRNLLTGPNRQNRSSPAARHHSRNPKPLRNEMLDEALFELSLGAGSTLEDTKNVVPLRRGKIVDRIDGPRSDAMSPDELT